MKEKQPVPGEERSIPRVSSDPVVNLALDTLALDRQLIVFVNTKRGAESQAEKIASKLSSSDELRVLSEKVLGVLSAPTKQCKRLAACIRKGVAFHHAGLPAQQRELIEDAFRNRVVRVICATPTLAAGVDLPAFRVVIRDLKRYGGPWGMSWIPVLEYEQQAGRAGRPGKDPWGEAVCIAKDDRDAQVITEKYLLGEPEDLTSKLAVEPVLRTYVLSLVAGGFVKTTSELFDFFSRTLYAHQYGDLGRLRRILQRMIDLLREWEFLKDSSVMSDGFTSAADLSREDDELLVATPLGRRVSELYLDPFTAFHLIKFASFLVQAEECFCSSSLAVFLLGDASLSSCEVF